MECSYCFENFDLNDKLPINLKCSHIYCQSCVIYLSDITRYCPIDNKLVEFNPNNLNTQIIESLNFNCPIHKINIIGICETCSTFICLSCQGSHTLHQLYMGSYNTLKNHLKKSIESAHQKSQVIVESMNKFENLDFKSEIFWLKEHFKQLNERFAESKFALDYNLSSQSKSKLLEKIKSLCEAAEDKKSDGESRQEQELKLFNDLMQAAELNPENFYSQANISKLLGSLDLKLPLTAQNEPTSIYDKTVGEIANKFINTSMLTSR